MNDVWWRLWAEKKKSYDEEDKEVNDMLEHQMSYVVERCVVDDDDWRRESQEGSRLILKWFQLCLRRLDN